MNKVEKINPGVCYLLTEIPFELKSFMREILQSISKRDTEIFMLYSKFNKKIELCGIISESSNYSFDNKLKLFLDKNKFKGKLTAKFMHGISNMELLSNLKSMI